MGWRARKRLSRGLQFDASYTRSKSLDTNSLNSSGFAVQDGYDIADQYGLSDFDARHRFVAQRHLRAAVQGTRDARLAGRRGRAGAERQSVNIVTSNSTLNGVAEHRASRRDRTDSHRGLRRPVVRSVGVRGRQRLRQPGPQRAHRPGLPQYGPGDHQERRGLPAQGRLQFRVDVFDLFNHPNFGPPGNIVGTPTSAGSRERVCPPVRRLVAPDPAGGEDLVLRCGSACHACCRPLPWR